MREEIYQCIVSYKNNHDGNTPSAGKIAELLGRRGIKITRGGVHWHLINDHRYYRKDGELCVEDGRWTLGTQPGGTGMKS